MFQEFPEDNKNEDFLNEFRQKISTQDRTSFEEKRNEMKRSKSVFIGAVSGVALAGVVGWFVLSPQYSQNSSSEIPVIRRPQTAIKVQPTEPGGMEILNQDKSIYDIIDKKSGNEPVVENLLPPPEQPKLPVIAAQPIVSEFETPAVAENPTIDKIIDEANSEDLVVEMKKIVEAKEPAMVKEAPTEKVVSISEVSKEKITIVEAPEVEIAKIEEPKKEVAPVKEEVVAKEAVAGSWQVQLMSSKNKAAMEKSWASLTKKYAVLKDQPHEVEVADLGFDGTYYRLKAGAFKDKAGADSLCKDIKALGGTCIVKKK